MDRPLPLRTPGPGAASGLNRRRGARKVSRPSTVRVIPDGLNFTLETDLGDLNLLGEIAGGGGYDELRPHSVEFEAFGLRLLCLDLDTLIRVKRAAGRPRDLEAIAELRVIREERDRRGS